MSRPLLLLWLLISPLTALAARKAARAPATNATPPEPTVYVPHIGRVHEGLFWIGAGIAGAIALYVLSSVIDWLRRAPCERCHSRKVRYAGVARRKDTPRRCLKCGWTND